MVPVALDILESQAVCYLLQKLLKNWNLIYKMLDFVFSISSISHRLLRALQIYCRPRWKRNWKALYNVGKTYDLLQSMLRLSNTPPSKNFHVSLYSLYFIYFIVQLLKTCFSLVVAFYSIKRHWWLPWYLGLFWFTLRHPPTARSLKLSLRLVFL